MLKKKLLTDKSGELYEKMLEDAAQRLSDDIDFEILAGMYTELGWTKVVLTPMTWETSDQIDLWLQKNCQGHYIDRGLVWIFENEKDANWFKMRWL